MLCKLVTNENGSGYIVGMQWDGVFGTKKSKDSGAMSTCQLCIVVVNFLGPRFQSRLLTQKAM